LDAVGIAAHKGTAVGGGVQLVLLDGVVAQHHIHRPAPGRHDDVFDDGPVVQHADRQPSRVGQDILVDRVPGAGEPEKFGFDLGHDVCLLPPAHIPRAAPVHADQMQKTILFSMIISQFQPLCREIFCVSSIIFQEFFGEFHRHTKKPPPPMRGAGADGDTVYASVGLCPACWARNSAASSGTSSRSSSLPMSTTWGIRLKKRSYIM